MQPSTLKPIPIPPRQQWRHFRVVYLPLITFVGLVLMIGWMWTRYVQPPTIVGEVETVRANIISIVDGTLHELLVDRLDSVTNGQPLAVVAAVDPDQLDAEIAAVEADLRLMKARMDLDKARNLNSYSQLRNELHIETFSLEVARINLEQAQAEFERAEKLLEQNLISRGVGGGVSGGNLITFRTDVGFEVTKRDRDNLRVEVAAREKTVADLQSALDSLKAAGAADIGPSDPAIEQAIAAQREHLGRLQKPTILRSPINGFVSLITQLPGAKVVTGDPILVISAEKSDRIVAWVRQPVTARPQVGDVVEVRRGTLGEAPFEATVVKVGKQLEEINATAVPITSTLQRAEFGLPLIVKVSDQLDLIPGEAVQIRILRHQAAN